MKFYRKKSSNYWIIDKEVLIWSEPRSKKTYWYYRKFLSPTQPKSQDLCDFKMENKIFQPREYCMFYREPGFLAVE